MQTCSICCDSQISEAGHGIASVERPICLWLLVGGHRARCAIHLQAGYLNVHEIGDLAFTVFFVGLGAFEIVIVSFRVVLQLALDGYAVPDMFRELYRRTAQGIGLAVAPDKVESIRNRAFLQAPSRGDAAGFLLSARKGN